MSIIYVGGQVADIPGGTTANTITYALTGGIDTRPRAGDLILLSYGISATANLTFGVLTAGYTEIAELYANDTYDSNLSVSWRIADATLLNVQVDATGSTANNGQVVIQVFRNVEPNNPIDVTSTIAQITNTGVVNPPAITPVTAGAMIVAIGATASNVTVTQTASYLTNFISGSNATGTNRIGVGAGYIPWTSGAYDPAAWTNSAGVVNSHSYCAVTLALRPAPVLTYYLDDTDTTSPPYPFTGAGSVVDVGASMPDGKARTGNISYTAGSYISQLTNLDTSWLRYRYEFRPNITANPTGSSAVVRLMTLDTEAGAAILSQRMTVTTAGAVTIDTVNENTGATIGSSFTYDRGWVSIEVLIDKTTNAVQVWMDGIQTVNVTGQSFPAANIGYVEFSGLASGGTGLTGALYYDAFEIAASSALWPTQPLQYPKVVGTPATGQITTASTSHVITMPTGIVAGEMLVAIVAGTVNNIFSTANTGWKQAGQVNSGGTSTVFYKIATGTDALTLTTTFSMLSSHVVYRVAGGKNLSFDFRSFATGSTNVNPGDWTPANGGDNCLQLLALTNIGTTLPTAQPVNHYLRTSLTAGISTGRSITVAERRHRERLPTTATGWTHTAMTSPCVLYISIGPTDLANIDHAWLEQTNFTYTSSVVTNHPITLPPNIEAGDLLLVFSTFGAATGVTSTGGWREVDEIQNATVTGVSHWKIAVGGDTMTLTSATATDRVTQVYVFKNAGGTRNKTQTSTIANYTAPVYDFVAEFLKEQKRIYWVLNHLMRNETGASLFARRDIEFMDGYAFGAFSHTAQNTVAMQTGIEPYKMSTLEFIGLVSEGYVGTTSTVTRALTGWTNGITGISTTLRKGDLVVLAYSVSSQTGVTPSVISAGWTTASDVSIGSVYDAGMVVAYKIMGATPDASVTLSAPGDTANGAAVVAFAYRGADQTTPVITPKFLKGYGLYGPLSGIRTAALGYANSQAEVVRFAAKARATTDATFAAPNGSTWRFQTTDTNSVTLMGNYYAKDYEPFVPSVRWTDTDLTAGEAWVSASLAVNPQYRPATQVWTFESGDFDDIYDWSATLANVVSETGQTGSFCGRVNLTSQEGFTYTDNLYEQKLYAQCKFKVNLTANPTVQEAIPLIHFRSSDNNSLVSVRMVAETNGALSLQTWNHYTSAQVGTATAINNNTWYTLALGVIVGFASNGSIETRLNGTTIVSATGVNNAGASYPYINKLQTRNGEAANGALTATGFTFYDEVRYDINDWPPFAAATGRPKFWNGSAWVQKPLKVWNGSAWVEKPVKVWNGTDWVTVT